MHERAVARVKGTQAQASLLCISRGGIAVGSAWPVSGRLSSELLTLSQFGCCRRVQRVVCRMEEGGQFRFLLARNGNGYAPTHDLQTHPWP